MRFLSASVLVIAFMMRASLAAIDLQSMLIDSDATSPTFISPTLTLETTETHLERLVNSTRSFNLNLGNPSTHSPVSIYPMTTVNSISSGHPLGVNRASSGKDHVSYVYGIAESLLTKDSSAIDGNRDVKQVPGHVRSHGRSSYDDSKVHIIIASPYTEPPALERSSSELVIEQSKVPISSGNPLGVDRASPGKDHESSIYGIAESLLTKDSSAIDGNRDVKQVPSHVRNHDRSSYDDSKVHITIASPYTEPPTRGTSSRELVIEQSQAPMQTEPPQIHTTDEPLITESGPRVTRAKNSVLPSWFISANTPIGEGSLLPEIQTGDRHRSNSFIVTKPKVTRARYTNLPFTLRAPDTVTSAQKTDWIGVDADQASSAEPSKARTDVFESGRRKSSTGNSLTFTLSAAPKLEDVKPKTTILISLTAFSLNSKLQATSEPLTNMHSFPSFGRDSGPIHLIMGSKRVDAIKNKLVRIASKAIAGDTFESTQNGGGMKDGKFLVNSETTNKELPVDWDAMAQEEKLRSLETHPPVLLDSPVWIQDQYDDKLNASTLAHSGKISKGFKGDSADIPPVHMTKSSTTAKEFFTSKIDSSTNQIARPTSTNPSTPTLPYRKIAGQYIRGTVELIDWAAHLRDQHADSYLNRAATIESILRDPLTKLKPISKSTPVASLLRFSSHVVRPAPIRDNIELEKVSHPKDLDEDQSPSVLVETVVPPAGEISDNAREKARKPLKSANRSDHNDDIDWYNSFGSDIDIEGPFSHGNGPNGSPVPVLVGEISEFQATGGLSIEAGKSTAAKLALWREQDMIDASYFPKCVGLEGVQMKPPPPDMTGQSTYYSSLHEAGLDLLAKGQKKGFNEKKMSLAGGAAGNLNEAQPSENASKELTMVKVSVHQLASQNANSTATDIISGPVASPTASLPATTRELPMNTPTTSTSEVHSLSTSILPVSEIASTNPVTGFEQNDLFWQLAGQTLGLKDRKPIQYIPISQKSPQQVSVKDLDGVDRIFTGDSLLSSLNGPTSLKLGLSKFLGSGQSLTARTVDGAMRMVSRGLANADIIYVHGSNTVLGGFRPTRRRDGSMSIAYTQWRLTGQGFSTSQWAPASRCVATKQYRIPKLFEQNWRRTIHWIVERGFRLDVARQFAVQLGATIDKLFTGSLQWRVTVPPDLIGQTWAQKRVVWQRQQRRLCEWRAGKQGRVDCHPWGPVITGVVPDRSEYKTELRTGYSDVRC